MTETTDTTTRRGSGSSRTLSAGPLAITALVGGVIIAVASFLPWFSAEAKVNVDTPVSFRISLTSDSSGWDLYSDRGDVPIAATGVKAKGLYFENFFGDGKPLTSGLATLLTGIVVAAAAILLMIVRGNPFVAFIAIAAAVLALVVCFTNLVSYLGLDLGPFDDLFDVSIAWGSVVLWIGALVSLALVPAALRDRGAR